jgi:hypothetical protein
LAAFISSNLATIDRCDRSSVRPLHPADPWENGYIECFNGRLREIFYTYREARIVRELVTLLQHDQALPRSRFCRSRVCTADIGRGVPPTASVRHAGERLTALAAECTR